MNHQKRIIGIVAVILAASFVAMAPTASAALSTEQNDIWKQLDDDLTSNTVGCSAGQETNGIPVTQGEEYIMAFSAGYSSLGQIYLKIDGGFKVEFTTRGSIKVMAAGFTYESLSSYHNGDGNWIYFGRIVPDVTGNMLLRCDDSSVLGYNAFGFPAGYSSMADLPGVIDVWGSSGAVFSPKILSEKGILDTETSKSNDKFNWARINPAKTLISQAGTTTTAYKSAEYQYAVEFTEDAAKGKYVETLTWNVDTNNLGPCTGDLHVSHAYALTHPWSKTDEKFNFTAPFSISADAAGDVTIDFLNGVISSLNSGLTFGTPVYSIGGSTVTDSSPPYADPTKTNYFRFKWVFDTGCSQTTQIFVTDSAGTYSGAKLYGNETGSWAEMTGNDMMGIQVKTYGGNKVEFTISTNTQTAGGAIYTYIKDEQVDTVVNKYTISSSFGGSSRYGSEFFEESGTGYAIREHRLGFLERPWENTQTLTVTVDMTGSGRNAIYAGTLTGTQPNSYHVGKFAFSATDSTALTSYQLQSTDDYYSKITVTVKYCKVFNSDGTCDPDNVGDPLNEVNYNGDVGGLRTFSGQTNTTGNFSVEGQDLPGRTVKFTVQKSKMQKEDYSIKIPSPGVYTFTAYMTNASDASGVITRSGVTVTFDPEDPHYDSGTVLINVTRSISTSLVIGFFKLDELGNPIPQTKIYEWSDSQNDKLVFEYPNGRTISANDHGKYVLTVMDTAFKTVDYTRVSLGSGHKSDFTVSLTLLEDLETVSEELQVQAAADSVKEQEETVYTKWLYFLGFVIGKGLFFPAGLEILIVFMVFAMVLRFGGGRDFHG